MSEALDELAATVQALGKAVAELRKQEAAAKAKAEREERKREAEAQRRAAALVALPGVPDVLPVIPGPLLTVPEAAAFLKASRTKLYELRSAGEVESVKMNGKRLFLRESLVAYVNRLREAS